MIYKNSDFLTLQRLRSECEPSEAKYCSVCGTENPDRFYVSIQTDECVGCSDCVNISSLADY